MTLQQIYYALTIARTGSMNKAAEKLFISQPTLTSAIKALEEEINITIFNRTNKGVVTTAEGNEFLANARSIYTQYEMLEEKYTSGNIKRKFGVSCQHYSFATKAFVNTVKKYGYDTSNYSFAIKETKTKNVISDVSDGRSEISQFEKGIYSIFLTTTKNILRNSWIFIIWNFTSFITVRLRSIFIRNTH